jgi:hypothetical protein
MFVRCVCNREVRRDLHKEKKKKRKKEKEKEKEK